MTRYGVVLLLILQYAVYTSATLGFLDPVTLQANAPAEIQQNTAAAIIKQYMKQVSVEVDPTMFKDHKDVFSLLLVDGVLHIKASTGVAAVWGFNYYLKKYCKSQIAWQVQRVEIPVPLPYVYETVVASDRFRYYQNVCTVSYSFVWWDVNKWLNHIEWMALNGINLALVPSAQEFAWMKIYKKIGMTDEEIDGYFTGPAFLSWLRMGNVHGWGGPLPKSWHERQITISQTVISFMYQLGMIPILPAFNGHVPKAFARIFPNTTFHAVQTWNKFNNDYCCNLFVSPKETLFQSIGVMFLKEMSVLYGDLPLSHIYTSDPFNEVEIEPPVPAEDTARAIFSSMVTVDPQSVWLIQNWMFVHDPVLWPLTKVKAFLTSVPIGRMLVLDLQSEQWPQYDIYQMYYGQPFIWCMLHNFGGTLGMFGSMKIISSVVYEVRKRANSTMIGIGLTPEGINQNYVVYDLMLESGWRKDPVEDLDQWVEDYAERRYGCNLTGTAWRYLLRSVYNFNGLNRMRGKYVITRRPSFKIKPWAWYKSRDLFEAFREFVFVDNKCDAPGFYLDLVDVTRQALQYRAEQIYNSFLLDRFSNTWVFETSSHQFLDVMNDLKDITGSNEAFSGTEWFADARDFGNTTKDQYNYELNARNQVTLWGPNGEISDYACKQWSVLFNYYYIPRWRAFLKAALEAKVRNEIFDEKSTQNVIRSTIESNIMQVHIYPTESEFSVTLAYKLYEKWAHIPGLQDLPQRIITRVDKNVNMGDENASDDVELLQPTVVTVNTPS